MEILLAIVLFSTGTIALLWAISTGLYASVGTENMDLALNIAQARMEEVKDMSFTDIVNEGSTGPTTDPNFDNFDVTTTVALGNDPMRIDVTVTWDVKGGENNVTLTTQVTSLN